MTLSTQLNASIAQNASLPLQAQELSQIESHAPGILLISQHMSGMQNNAVVTNLNQAVINSDAQLEGEIANVRNQFLNFVNTISESIHRSENENEQLRNQLLEAEEAIHRQKQEQNDEASVRIQELASVKSLIEPLQIDVVAHRQDEAVARLEEAAALNRAAATRAREFAKRQANIMLENQMRNGLRSVGCKI